MGVSLLNLTVKPICFFGEGELNSPELGVAGAVRRDNFPIGVVNGRTETVDGIPTDQTRLIYDGFVLFGKDGALSGFCIRLEDEDERSRFTKKFVKLLDVLVGPVNLEKCAVCHG
jgi:hypothetical protein